MNALSLCSGVGGLDLACQQVFHDSRTVAYCEIDPFCQAILCLRQEDGWLDRSPIWPDIRSFDGRAWRGLVDCVISGFPCQPFSVAGKRRGDTDARNLWPDVRRIIGESQPAVVILENVPGALPYFFHVVLPELQGMGYRTQAGLFTAAEVGAPHRRERLFLVGLSELARRETPRLRRDEYAGTESEAGSGEVGDSDQPRLEMVLTGGDVDSIPPWPPGPTERDRWAAVLACWPELAPAVAVTTNRQNGSFGSQSRRLYTSENEAQSFVRRVADGIFLGLDRTARLRALGNAVVPVQAIHAIKTLLGELKL